MTQKSALQVAGLVVLLTIGWPLLILGLVAGIGWCLYKTGQAAVRHPIIAGYVAALVALTVVFGVQVAWFAFELSLVVVPVGLAVLRIGFPDRWHQLAARRRRRRRHARQIASWATLAVSHGLGFDATRKTVTGRTHVTSTVPGLVSLDCGAWRDRYVVRPLPNQRLDDFASRAEALALHLGAREVRATLGPPGHVVLDVLHGDPLTDVVRPFAPLPAGAIDLSALRVGLLEDGQLFTVQAGDGAHLLIAGETKAGKSSVVWAIFAELAPLIPSGTVRLWGIDPKSQEVPFAPGLFYRSATSIDGAEAMVQLLEDAADEMQATATAMAGLERSHTPSPDSPLNVIYVDELAWITAYQANKRLKERAVNAMAAITTQGRTCGYWLIGAVQSPKADVVAFRELFPVRIGLRLSEAGAVEMVLGKGTRDAGAYCDLIPRNLRGIGYARLEDGALVRFRAVYLDDRAVQTLEHAYPAPRRLQLVEDQGDHLEAAS